MLLKDLFRQLPEVWYSVRINQEDLYRYDDRVDRYCDVSADYKEYVAIRRRGRRVSICQWNVSEISYYQIGGSEIETRYACCGDHHRSIIQNVLREHGEKNVVFLKGHDEF